MAPGSPPSDCDTCRAAGTFINRLSERSSVTLPRHRDREATVSNGGLAPETLSITGEDTAASRRDVPSAVTDSVDPTRAVDPASHSTSTWTVLGEQDAIDGVGVLGHTTATTGSGTGLVGVTDAAALGAAGVKGTATASSGLASGVFGQAEERSGLKGNSINGNGVYGQATGVGVGVRGETVDGTRMGVVVANFATSSTAGAGRGVLGYTESFGDGSVGVDGRARGTSGVSYGVRGRTDSADAGAAGVSGTAMAGSGTTRGVHGTTP